MDTFSCCAYCWKREDSWDQLPCYKCGGCQKRVHYDCIRSSQPSPLLGDTFFSFKCEACGHAGKEEFSRSNMSWHNVVLLALYNLHKTSQGRCGYFHWKGHIGSFIDQNWNTIFGYQRKKTSVWMGTVAGTLSVGCPEYFLSGTQVGQQGHWRLAQVIPPMATAEKKKQTQRKKIKETPVELNPDKRKCRRVKENALAAAVGLKEKRSTLGDIKELKKQKCPRSEDRFSGSTSTPADTITGFSAGIGGLGKAAFKKSDHWSSLLTKELAHSPGPATSTKMMEEPHLADSFTSTDLLQASSSFSFLTGDDSSSLYEPGADLGDLLFMTDEYDLDLGLMVTEISADPRPPSPDMGIMLNTDLGVSSYNMPASKSPVSVDRSVKQVALQSDSESECPSEKNIKDDPTSGSEDEREAKSVPESDQERENGEEEKWPPDELHYVSGDKKRVGRPLKRKKPDDSNPVSPPQQLQRISLFEEGELLQKLNGVAAKQKLRPEMAQLRRKLICNQTNREFGLPVFDLEYQMEKLAKLDKNDSQQQQENPKQQNPVQYLPTKVARTKETRDLDRFMIHDSNKKMESRHYTSFYQRLVGFQDHELTPVISPYTTRVLLPFIWRNFEISHKPLKLRLLQEIQAYAHRNDPSWVQPPCSPLDYCYVRPEHVPSVNALCREFFWPGIDVSECLQYPDFSCVVLYKKIVIAFAFMVPDRGYNEAYISFIFTHPEWRGAGIATFMIYHLIQTCMGKDVLLHVSVNNPAMLLYQKFGFKCQELALNFYHKYFPLNSKESTHAFLMRLSR